MFPYPSTQFQAAIQGSHNVAVSAEIWEPGGTAPLVSITQIQDAPSTTTPSLVLTDGSVTYDKGSDQRSQCTATFISPDGTLIPTTNTSPLTPWGNELRLYRGVWYPPSSPYLPGQTEMVPLGYFRISKVDLDDSKGAVTMTVTGYDRSRNISRNVVPFYWPDLNTQSLILGQSWANMIQVACQDRWSPVVFNDTAANWALLENDPVNGAIGQNPQAISFGEGTDLWSQMRQYAMAAGCSLYFSRQGVCTMVKDPNFNNMTAATNAHDSAVARFVEGSTAVFDSIKRSMDDSVSYNYVVVYGDGQLLTGPLFNFPPNGTPAVDNDPTSPTYVGTGIFVGNRASDGKPMYSYNGSGSKYGLVPHIVTNNLLTSQTMVDNFAQLQLMVDIGAQEMVTIPSQVVNPCLDVDDIITVTRSRLGLTDASGKGYVTTNVKIPLTAKGAQELQVREKRTLVP